MLIRHFMTRQVFTLESEMLCTEAWGRFQEKGLRRAPVVLESKVVGMITDRDLMRVLPWTIGDHDRRGVDERLTTTVGGIARRALISVDSGDHLETAARRMLENRIGGLPVIDGGQLVGIITESDLFRVFVRLKQTTGGTRLTWHWPEAEVELPDPARVALATGVEIREHFRHPSPFGGVLVGLRVAGGHIDDFQERLQSEGFLLIDREDSAGD